MTSQPDAGSSPQPIVLVGAGGHCRSCIDVIESRSSFKIVAIVGQPGEQHTEVLGYEVRYLDTDLPVLIPRFRNFLICVGQIKSVKLRKCLYDQIRHQGGHLPSVVSKHAIVSRHASVGPGTVVMHGAIINAGATVGANCIINSQSLIEHDATVEDHCHISTGATVNGSSRVGRESFVGSHAVLHHAISVRPKSIITAGDVVSPQHARVLGSG